MWYKGYTGLRLHFDARKDRKLRETVHAESDLPMPKRFFIIAIF
ncbi:MAG TPA: hypothetical protein VGF61_02825 [Candidatus Acidoferrum sp.]|jgi:hypothetical protein